MLKTKLVFISVGLVIAFLAIGMLVLHSSGTPPIRITFMGFTNSPAGTQLAVFEVRNELKRRIARNGYCRVNGDVIDIQSTKSLRPEESETVEVPIRSYSGTSLPLADLIAVKFSGVKELSFGEDAMVAIGGFLKKAGIESRRLEALTDLNRWEVSHEFEAQPRP